MFYGFLHRGIKSDGGRRGTKKRGVIREQDGQDVGWGRKDSTKRGNGGGERPTETV